MSLINCKKTLRNSLDFGNEVRVIRRSSYEPVFGNSLLPHKSFHLSEAYENEMTTCALPGSGRVLEIHRNSPVPVKQVRLGEVLCAAIDKENR
jgi:hypothetical protein